MTSAGINLRECFTPACMPAEANNVFVGPGVNKIVTTSPINKNDTIGKKTLLITLGEICQKQSCIVDKIVVTRNITNIFYFLKSNH